MKQNQEKQQERNGIPRDIVDNKDTDMYKSNIGKMLEGLKSQFPEIYDEELLIRIAMYIDSIYQLNYELGFNEGWGHGYRAGEYKALFGEKSGLTDNI
jgi:DUF1680 family protein